MSRVSGELGSLGGWCIGDAISSIFFPSIGIFVLIDVKGTFYWNLPDVYAGGYMTIDTDTQNEE